MKPKRRAVSNWKKYREILLERAKKKTLSKRFLREKAQREVEAKEAELAERRVRNLEVRPFTKKPQELLDQAIKIIARDIKAISRKSAESREKLPSAMAKDLTLYVGVLRQLAGDNKLSDREKKALLQGKSDQEIRQLAMAALAAEQFDSPDDMDEAETGVESEGGPVDEQ